ncbi:MAG: redoxin domain-containing protein [Nitrospiraceae bacterium]|nr:redoxin domain-containing protein [Nitrospiraceae bacterium]
MIAVLAALAFSAAMAFEGVEVGKPAPVLKLKDVQGEAFSTDTIFNGEANVIVFCRVGQSYSEKLLKDLQEIYDELQKKGLRAAAVFSGKVESSAVGELGKKLGLKFPLLLDPDRESYGRYGVIVTPATGFIDKKGLLRFYCASYQRDFMKIARANVGFLLGDISAAEREERLRPKKEAAKLNPAVTEYRLGLKLLKKGSTDAAKEMLRQAWESKPPYVEAGVELGFLLLQEGANEEALALFADVTRLAPKHARAGGGRGVALLRTGEKDEGRASIEQALSAGAEAPLFYYELGLLSESQGNATEALGFYRQGLELALDVVSSP